MKDMPKVYENIIDKKINNSQEIFFGNVRNSNNVTNKESIYRKINNIFLSVNHVYKSNVEITFKDNTVRKTIVGKTNKELITIDGELISINDIEDIKRI